MPKVEIELDIIPIDNFFRMDCNGSPIVVIRTKTGISAFFDRCPHAHWPLSEGELREGYIYCVGHGWLFDVATGRCLTTPICSLKPLSVILDRDRVQIEWD